jgi:predicted nucleotidyltransferase
MKEFIKSVASILNKYEIEYLIVGGAAKLLYNQKWRPSDLDILVYSDMPNLIKLNIVLKNEKMISQFQKGKIIRIVGKPYSIDIHPKLDGLILSHIKNRTRKVYLDKTPIKLIDDVDLKINLQTVKTKIDGIISI